MIIGNYTFDSKARVHMSDDLGATVRQIVEALGGGRVGMLVDVNLSENEYVQRLVEALKSDVELKVETSPGSEPTTAMVDDYAERFAQGRFDSIVGIGGGSTLDLTKAVSVIAVNPGSVTEYHGTGKALLKAIPKILVPTTAGTGAEVTSGAVLVNKETGFKRGLGGDLVTADHAVLFPRITMSMPDSVAASTGMDALAHAIESYTCKEANPITRMYSRQAFALIYPNLMKTLDDPEDLESRRALLLGSCLAGYAIYNSNTGACHAISYPLGIHHLVPHGIAIGMLIPEVMKINIEKGCNLYERLIDETHGDAAAVLDDLLNDFGPRKYLPKTMAEFGIKPKDVPELAERGMDLKPAIDANPVVFTVDDATRALASVT